jgi:hypothetical protein
MKVWKCRAMMKNGRGIEWFIVYTKTITSYRVVFSEVRFPRNYRNSRTSVQDKTIDSNVTMSEIIVKFRHYQAADGRVDDLQKLAKQRLQRGMRFLYRHVWLMFDNAWLYNRNVSKCYGYCTNISYSERCQSKL